MKPAEEIGDIMEERYIRNIPAISAADQELIGNSHVLVIGCGGLGGYIIEYLARLGVGKITAVDGDVFSESNLNRQLLCTVSNIGKPKAMAAADRVSEVNPNVKFNAVCEFFTAENASELMNGVDLIIDALDNVDSRLLLEDTAAKARLAIVHGAIEGWNIQAMLVPPASGLLHRIYVADSKPAGKSSLPTTPAVCAGLQVSLAIEYLSRKSTALDNKLLMASIKSMSFDTIDLGF